MACTVGSATQVSVHRPASTIFFRPVFLTAATKVSSSQEFIDERSMMAWVGNTACTCGQRFPLKALVSTVLRMTGTSNTRVALDRKSTRLNSSHGYISYAVFCLKKKKK